jgi:hypothetical protein
MLREKILHGSLALSGDRGVLRRLIWICVPALKLMVAVEVMTRVLIQIKGLQLILAMVTRVHNSDI